MAYPCFQTISQEWFNRSFAWQDHWLSTVLHWPVIVALTAAINAWINSKSLLGTWAEDIMLAICCFKGLTLLLSVDTWSCQCNVHWLSHGHNKFWTLYFTLNITIIHIQAMGWKEHSCRLHKIGTWSFLLKLSPQDPSIPQRYQGKDN